MKATLEFNLPEEQGEFENANKGIDYYCALFNIQEDLIRLRKDGVVNYDDITRIIDLFLSRLDEHNVTLDK